MNRPLFFPIPTSRASPAGSKTADTLFVKSSTSSQLQAGARMVLPVRKTPAPSWDQRTSLAFPNLSISPKPF